MAKIGSEFKISELNIPFHGGHHVNTVSGSENEYQHRFGLLSGRPIALTSRGPSLWARAVYTPINSQEVATSAAMYLLAFGYTRC